MAHSTSSSSYCHMLFVGWRVRAKINHHIKQAALKTGHAFDMVMRGQLEMQTTQYPFAGDRVVFFLKNRLETKVAEQIRI